MRIRRAWIVERKRDCVGLEIESRSADIPTKRLTVREDYYSNRRSPARRQHVVSLTELSRKDVRVLWEACERFLNPARLRVVVTGDRRWTAYGVIREVVQGLRPRPALIAHGGAKGADRMAAAVGLKMRVQVLEFPADWGTYGKKAGMIRNQQMLTDSRPNLVLVFHNNLGESKGTKHMVSIARKANVPVWVFTEKGRAQ